MLPCSGCITSNWHAGWKVPRCPGRHGTGCRTRAIWAGGRQERWQGTTGRSCIYHEGVHGVKTWCELHQRTAWLSFTGACCMSSPGKMALSTAANGHLKPATGKRQQLERSSRVMDERSEIIVAALPPVSFQSSPVGFQQCTFLQSSLPNDLPTGS